MSVLTYCTGWHRIFKEAAEILVTDKARQLHRARKPYTVIVERDADVAVVEMCFFQAYCHVLFLDEMKRVAERHSFVETADGRLFIEEVAVHYYAGDGERPTHGKILRFQEDGSLTLDTGRAGGPISRQEGRTDVSRNYAPLPEFGSYDSLVKRER